MKICILDPTSGSLKRMKCHYDNLLCRGDSLRISPSLQDRASHCCCCHTQNRKKAVLPVGRWFSDKLLTQVMITRLVGAELGLTQLLLKCQLNQACQREKAEGSAVQDYPQLQTEASMHYRRPGLKTKPNRLGVVLLLRNSPTLNILKRESSHTIHLGGESYGWSSLMSLIRIKYLSTGGTCKKSCL